VGNPTVSILPSLGGRKAVSPKDIIPNVSVTLKPVAKAPAVSPRRRVKASPKHLAQVQQMYKNQSMMFQRAKAPPKVVVEPAQPALYTSDMIARMSERGVGAPLTANSTTTSSIKAPSTSPAATAVEDRGLVSRTAAPDQQYFSTLSPDSLSNKRRRSNPEETSDMGEFGDSTS